MCGLTTDAVAQAFLIPPATLAQRVVRAKPRIVNLYEALLRLSPSPVIELNRAAAIALRDDPAAGLVLIDAILARRFARLSLRARG